MKFSPFILAVGSSVALISGCSRAGTYQLSNSPGCPTPYLVNTETGQVSMVKDDGVEEIPSLGDVSRFSDWHDLPGTMYYTHRAALYTPRVQTAWIDGALNYSLTIDTIDPNDPGGEKLQARLTGGDLDFTDSHESGVCSHPISAQDFKTAHDDPSKWAVLGNIPCSAGKYYRIKKYGIRCPAGFDSSDKK